MKITEQVFFLLAILAFFAINEYGKFREIGELQQEVEGLRK